MKVSNPEFPFCIFEHADFPGERGEIIRKLKPWSLFPPYPWGQWMYARLFDQVCGELEGDFIELGVGIGGMSLLFGHLAKEKQKQVYSYDSFEGLPEPHQYKDNPYFRKGDYQSYPEIKLSLFERFNISKDMLGLKDTVTVEKGFFEDVLAGIDVDQKYCMAHFDSDLYDSVTISLEHVYDRVIDGGVIIFDDFFHPAQGPFRAVADFFNQRDITPVFHVSFPYSVFIFKGERSNEACDLCCHDGNIYSLEWLRSDDHLKEVLSQYLDLMACGSRSHDNCKQLLDLLNADSDPGRDIYTYWKALEDFWHWVAKGLAQNGTDRPVIQI